MKYVVLGAGMMGSAVAYDLAVRNPEDVVILADIDLERASRSAQAIAPNVQPVRVDVNNSGEVGSVLAVGSVVISAVSYSVNYQLSRSAIRAGAHMVDLGGNNDVVQAQLGLDQEARSRGVTIVPNSGLAPGLVPILVMEGIKEFDRLDSIHLRVGGLPQHPRPPLNYQLVFSVEGLINEYVEKVTAIRNGNLVQIEPMSDLEDIAFPEPFGTLEAFNTSGGLSELPRLLLGKVRTLDYKTIRYRGHCEKFRTLLDLGFASSEPIMVGDTVKTNRELFSELLRKKLDHGDKDVVLARATITGMKETAEKVLVYEFIDHYDDATNMTAMMRTTSFPTSIIAQMLAHNIITRRGVTTPEMCVPGGTMIEELGKRHVNITKHVTVARS